MTADLASCIFTDMESTARFAVAARQPRNPALGAWAVIRVEQDGRRTRTTEVKRIHWEYNERDSAGNRERSDAAKAKAQDVRKSLSVSLDELTRQTTGFASFAALVDAHYTPTLRNLDRLADAYDAAQAARGSSRRASRF